MSFRPILPRPIAVREANSLCLQCWRRLAKAPLQSRQTFSSISSHREGAVASRGRPYTVGKDYFRANPILKETFWTSRQELQSSIVSIRSGNGQLGAKEHATATADEVLPHRRRKKAKEDAAAVENTEAAYPIPHDASSKLAHISSSLPQQSLKRILTTYLSLSKPRLSFLVVLTATAAYSLYPVPGLLAPAATATPSLSTLTLFFLTSGTALCSASANAFNMIMEPAHDAKMSRTRNRPLVRKLISPRGAIIFAIACGLVGTGALYYGVNPTTAFLGAANIFLYAGIYTPMKRMHVLNTWVGAIVGGIPPLMGWTAAANQYAYHGTWDELLFGEGSAGGWLCAALLYAWQFPHFNALSWAIRDEYKNAGYRMLAWVNPAMNGRVALRYSILMFPICIGLSYCGVTDWSYVITSSAVNGWMTLKAWQFWKAGGHKGTARGLFWASIWHLPIVMVLAMAQKKGLGERIYRSLFGYADIDEEDLYYEVGKLEEEEQKHLALVQGRRDT
ncbi:protoheme IX farnesyltransferase mitochondrial precursor [Pyrenophora tritici-repentis]|uniref:Protoheme IX farnesyltransferase, mitochondrial n=2 Tax=Pyrenophora tritici-repentis TaxID=45151 RepID=A0A2W1E6C2_9PLEO|nr:protoheme IX farnesyltransferase, mitochondrial precursor [Pyrenophora tritici-repentis Pt-1C-BFP]KAA8615078.1 Protoheme IX farnesyltransferase mitochondrial [Pyrenophora tritici-repentis]EDU50403.1 protoheme IX farnesyltransferase, mitochondrial precursor [Pyrenophora tritici-repentis Pt-1C-BFP]KAF7444898.1 Protoheme IX farnesyltransferase mitochondrial [Pyrenophora tritici-repentis]KAF7564432.1 UbiA domain containing protein [Pyrenophora tritici-repentis]KAG9379138.1 Protoheme IX farnesyl